MSTLTAYVSVEAWMVLAAAMVPLVAAAACAWPATRRVAPVLAALSAVPAFVIGIVGADVSGQIDWLGTGTHIALDPTSRAFLLLAAAIWTVAGVYAFSTIVTARPRFFGFFALAMAGNLGLTVAIDPAGFYTFFSMMALSTYALVAHGNAGGERAAPGDPAGTPARRAGRIYMAFTVIGEAVVLSGFFVLVVGGVALTPLATALLLLGFGIKIGMPGVHGWMPVAYAAAPAAAAAALSGSMSTAGVLGIIRFVPGAGELPLGIGVTMMALGLVAAFGGALVGVVQREPAHVLAYSSVSQFGLITVAIGVGLTSPEVWPLAVIAATVYAVHHGLAKAALFLGGDMALHSRRRVTELALLGLPALALAGLPLTSGTVAKLVLKDATGQAPEAWHVALDALLPLAAVGTTALVLRFCYLTWLATHPEDLRGRRPRTAGAALAWGALLVAVGVALWLWPEEAVRYAGERALTGTYLWLATWPVLLGAALAVAAWLTRSITSRLAGAIPPADIYAPVFSVAHELVEARENAVASVPASPSPVEKPAAATFVRVLDAVGRIESGLLVWATAIAAAGTLVVFVLILALAR